MRTILVGAVLLTLAMPARAVEYISASEQAINVRVGPSPRAKVLRKAWRFTPFEIVEWGEEWAKVRDYRGRAGWVHQSVLSSAPTVIVVGKRANVREGPGRAFDVAWELEREYSLKVVGYDGDWVQVTDGVDVHGWIHRRLVWGSKDAWRSEGGEV